VTGKSQSKFASLSRTKNIHLGIIVLTFILYMYLPAFPFLGPRNALSPEGGMVMLGIGVAWILYGLAVFVWVSARTVQVLMMSRKHNPIRFHAAFTIGFFAITQMLAVVIITSVIMGQGLGVIQLVIALIITQSLSLVFVPELAQSL
jgi:hypothetical protein